ncbi:MAG: MmgE/PrpD family protein [Chloroflexota bacterium]
MALKPEGRLVDFLQESRFADLPGETVAFMKDIVLGIFGTTVAGCREDGCTAVRELVREWGGREQATVLGYGDRVPAANAALVNGTMARALDFDEVLHGPGAGACHAGALAVPAALAVAELRGGATGQEFLAALVPGMEIAARINAVTYYDGVEGTGFCGIFASTAIAGKLLGLSREQLFHAFGLALNRASGTLQNYTEHTLAPRLVEGWAARDGITCAQLAQRGVTGPREFLTGPYGYFHLFNRDRYDLQALTGSLGRDYYFTRAEFKKAPFCGGMIDAIGAVTALVKEKGLTAEAVAGVEVRLPDSLRLIVGNPFIPGANPKVTAQFSIQYGIASVLLRGGCRLHDFSEESIREPAIARLIEKIRVDASPDSRTTIAITTGDGADFTVSVDAPHGPAHPPTPEEHLSHFRECLRYAREAGTALPDAEKLPMLVGKLEKLEDVRTLLPYLVSPFVNSHR